MLHGRDLWRPFAGATGRGHRLWQWHDEASATRGRWHGEGGRIQRIGMGETVMRARGRMRERDQAGGHSWRDSCERPPHISCPCGGSKILRRIAGHATHHRCSAPPSRSVHLCPVCACPLLLVPAYNLPSRPRGHDGRGNLTVGPGDRFAPTAAVPRACFSRRDRGSPPANGLMGRTPLMVYGAKLVAAKWRRCSRRIGRWTAY